MSVKLGSLFYIITRELNLTFDVIPSMNIAAGLLGFFFVEWIGFLLQLGLSIAPFRGVRTKLKTEIELNRTKISYTFGSVQFNFCFSFQFG